jgi:hypothetical protein
MQDTTKDIIATVGVWVLMIGAYVGVVSINGSDTTSSNIDCSTETVNYEEVEEYSDLVPEWDSPVVQNGVDGEREICLDDDGEEISSEIVVEPVNKVTIVGTGNAPSDMSGEFSDSDYAENWENNGGITRNFNGELWTMYWERQEEEESYITPTYSYRVGAICADGSYSSATGRGACSWHGGVSEWVYE